MDDKQEIGILILIFGVFFLSISAICKFEVRSKPYEEYSKLLQNKEKYDNLFNLAATPNNKSESDTIVYNEKQQGDTIVYDEKQQNKQKAETELASFNDSRGYFFRFVIPFIPYCHILNLILFAVMYIIFYYTNNGSFTHRSKKFKFNVSLVLLFCVIITFIDGIFEYKFYIPIYAIYMFTSLACCYILANSFEFGIKLELENSKLLPEATPFVAIPEDKYESMPLIIPSCNLIPVNENESINNKSKIEVKEVDTYINIRNLFRSIFVCGGAGGGKTESTAIPLIFTMAKHEICGIIYDFKNFDLSCVAHSAYSKYFEKDKTKIRFKVVSFTDLQRSNRINPIHPVYLENNLYIKEFVKTFFVNLNREYIKKTDYFATSAMNTLTGTIIYFKNKKPEYCDLPHIVTFLSHPVDDILEILSTDEEALIYCRQLVDALKKGAGEEASGVINSLRTELNAIVDRNFFWVLSGNDFSLDLNNPEHPTLLCLVNNGKLIKSISPILSLIVSVATKMTNQSGKLPCGYILDEAPTLYIPEIERLPATGRSNLNFMCYIIQDKSQSYKDMDKDTTNAIINNCANHFYFRTTDKELIQDTIYKFGKQDVEIEGKSKNNGFSYTSNSVNTSTSAQLREVIQSQDFSKLKTGECFAIIADAPEENTLVKTQIKQIFDTPYYDVSNESEVRQQIPKLNDVTEEMIETNYRKIFEEVRNFIQNFKDEKEEKSQQQKLSSIKEDIQENIKSMVEADDINEKIVNNLF